MSTITMLFSNLPQATKGARLRTGDETLGTRVKKGRFQVVRTTYNERGRSTVIPVSEWLSLAEVIVLLESMK